MIEEHHIDCPRLTNPGLACLCNLIREFGTPQPADIVTKLREWHDQRDSWQTLTEAADEIERLRLELDRWRGIAHALTFVPWSPAYLDGLEAYRQAVRGE